MTGTEMMEAVYYGVKDTEGMTIEELAEALRASEGEVQEAVREWQALQMMDIEWRRPVGCTIVSTKESDFTSFRRCSSFPFKLRRALATCRKGKQKARRWFWVGKASMTGPRARRQPSLLRSLFGVGA